ncbi:Targeting protein for Xklp2 [Harpegnathos saltator]|uniref:Targeting protein for Xklp2 n=2 Tax=Harpegnathos saltator TaxID=610380 RepID=E2BW70_HARSA|nr:Targeting protein for Xklp2 [Harpegnathos saltator]
MDSFIAPQWMDFTESISPQIPMKDYFDKEHAIHGRIVELGDLPMENAENISTNILCVSKEAQQDQDIIKNAPVIVVSSKYRKKTDKTETGQITYDDVLTDAMEKLKLCKKPLKSKDMLSKTIQDPTFKTPNMFTTKSSRSVGYRSVPNKSVQCNTARRSVRTDKDVCTLEKNNDITPCKTKVSTSSLCEQDKASVKDDILEKADVQINDHENEGEEYTVKEYTEEHEQNKGEDQIASHDKEEQMDNDKEEQNDVDAIIGKHSHAQSHKSRTSVLTWKNGRRSLNKHRGSNRFVSLAEAVLRFQNDIPKRFRTKSNKDPLGTSQNPSLKSSLHHRLKPTIPISPALTSKNRIRGVTVLSQEEREKLEMKEMKKHQIKANPVPLSVLRGPARPVSKAVAKKPTLANVAENSSSASMTQHPEKTATNISARLKNSATLHHDKMSMKNTVTKVLVTDPTGIIVEYEKIPYFGVPKDGTARSVTRVVPFSFEARNKDLQMKKEQRLKSLQEASKAKTEFHARPMPNISKPPLTTPLPAIKQQKEKRKTMMQQCPFSFEERDKNLSKKKEELAKQMLKEDKQMRMFHAKPAPIFKPVMVRGISKEYLSMKEITKTEKEHMMDKYDDQENEKPNIVSTEKTQESKCMQKTKKRIACITVDKHNVKDKRPEENTIKTTLPLELNTDKRAKERREFDEKMKRKEMEEETKREEEKKRQQENEKQMRAEQRKLMEVKARPMPTYKSLIITKAAKPLTEPQSPALSNKYRSKQP